MSSESLTLFQYNGIHHSSNQWSKYAGSLCLIKIDCTPLRSSFNAKFKSLIQILIDKINKSRASVFNELRSKGIGVNIHYIPIYTQPYYQSMGFKFKNYPNTEHYYQRAISLPLFHSMTTDQQNKVVGALKEVLLWDFV